MIGRLRGAVAEVGEEEALIDVLGVGYQVRCGARALARLTPGEETTIHVESTWSEAAGPRLYGFLSREERGAFVALQAIQGVGPKAALAVLDVLTPGELAGAAARDDRTAVARASGVGPKLAARIVAELKSRPIAAGLAAAAIPPIGAPALLTAAGEATAALLGLGVVETTARRATDLAVARLGEGASTADLIKAALQELGR